MDDAPSTITRTIYVDSYGDGDVWLGGESAGSLRQAHWNGGGWDWTSHLTDHEIIWTIGEQGGGLWVGCKLDDDNRLQQYDHDTSAWIGMYDKENTRVGGVVMIPNARMNDLAEDAYGNLWMANNRGIVKRDGSTLAWTK